MCYLPFGWHAGLRVGYKALDRDSGWGGVGGIISEHPELIRVKNESYF